MERQRAFLVEFEHNGNVTRSCERVGVARSTVYEEWMPQAEFKAAFDYASEGATDLLEDEARRRAVDGVSKPVYQGGKKVGIVQEYSDSLLMFLLRGKRDIYREKRSIGVGVEGTGQAGLRKVIIELDETGGATPS